MTGDSEIAASVEAAKQSYLPDLSPTQLNLILDSEGKSVNVKMFEDFKRFSKENRVSVVPFYYRDLKRHFNLNKMYTALQHLHPHELTVYNSNLLRHILSFSLHLMWAACAKYGAFVLWWWFQAQGQIRPRALAHRYTCKLRPRRYNHIDTPEHRRRDTQIHTCANTPKPIDIHWGLAPQAIRLHRTAFSRPKNHPPSFSRWFLVNFESK